MGHIKNKLVSHREQKFRCFEMQIIIQNLLYKIYFL